MNKPRLLNQWDENETHRDQWLPLILDYQDGTLEGSELDNLKQHLEGCGVCKADLEGMRQGVSLLQRLPEIPAPRSFTLSPVTARRLKPAPVYRFAQFAAAMAAAFLIFAFALDLSGAFTPPAPAPVVAVATADPTATLEPVGTLASSTGNGTSGSNGALSAPNPTASGTQSASPTATAPANTQNSAAASPAARPDFRLIEVILLVATVLLTAFVFALRPRLPGRLKI